jgi:hypothetical protein
MASAAKPWEPHRERACHLGGLTDPDLGTVAALAQLQLWARRRGLDLRFCHPTRALVELAEFLGLAEVLGLMSAVEARGEPEQREQAAGGQEGVHGPDLPP